MKSLMLLTVFFALNANAQTESPCEPPRYGVKAEISGFGMADNGQTFCYATELDTARRYPVLDCGSMYDGARVRGTVRTHWTHKDLNGNPVCDYQTFVIENPQD